MYSGAVNFAYQYSFAPTRKVGVSELAGGDFLEQHLYRSGPLDQFELLSSILS